MRGQKKGFTHTEETKKIISEAAKGEGKGGFNVKINCPICQQEMSPANLGKHKPACEELQKYKRLFIRKDISTRDVKSFRINIKKNYGLTLEGYAEMFDKQNGACSICKKTPSPDHDNGRRLFVDHCHDTGKVRGLLCGNCNFSLGGFYDSIENLQQAIIYLESQSR